MDKDITSMLQMRDPNGILDPSIADFSRYPCLLQYSKKTSSEWQYDPLRRCAVQAEYASGLKDAMNLVHSTSGLVTMKMLMMYADGNEHCWHEISDKMFPGYGYGHDIDCWRSIQKRGLIDFHSKRDRGKKFYVLSSLGKEVLDIAKKNDVCFRVLRWFKLDEDEIIPAMMKADLQGEESYKDTEPEAVIAMLQALFDRASAIRQLGSAYRWMNMIARFMKKSSSFYKMMRMPEVVAWIDAHSSSHEVDAFRKKFIKT